MYTSDIIARVNADLAPQPITRDRLAKVEYRTKMKLSSAALDTLLVVAAFRSDVGSGHGFLAQPLAIMILPTLDRSAYSSSIDSYKLFPGGTFNTDTRTNIASFQKHFKKSKYKSIKAMIMDNQVLVSKQANAVCGFSSPEKASYGALNSTIYWGRDIDITKGEGFVHDGPCETWCDGHRVQHNRNCMVAYKSDSGASPIPIDNTKCTSAKRLTIYWIAMHGAKWQVYINCVGINGGGGSSSTKAPPKTATTPKKAKTPAYPTISTSKPPSTANTPKALSKPTPTTTPTTAAAFKPSDTVGGEADSAHIEKCSRRRIRD